MEEIRNILKEREKYLCELKSEKEKELKTAPEGLLRVCNSRNRIQYYHRTDPKDFLLVTYETSKSPLNQKVIMRMIQRYLK